MPVSASTAFVQAPQARSCREGIGVGLGEPQAEIIIVKNKRSRICFKLPSNIYFPPPMEPRMSGVYNNMIIALNIHIAIE